MLANQPKAISWARKSGGINQWYSNASFGAVFWNH